MTLKREWKENLRQFSTTQSSQLSLSFFMPRHGKCTVVLFDGLGSPAVIRQVDSVMLLSSICCDKCSHYGLNSILNGLELPDFLSVEHQ